MAEKSWQPAEAAAFDTWLGSSSPDSNQGTNVSLAMETLSGKGQDKERPILIWDISELIGKTLLTAKLTLEAGAVDDRTNTATIYRITQAGVTEAGVTWNKYDGVNAWTAAGGDYTTPSVAFAFPTSPEMTFEISGAALVAFLQDALDNRSGLARMLIRLDDPYEAQENKGCYWRSSNYATEADRPKLEVTYAGVVPKGIAGSLTPSGTKLILLHRAFTAALTPAGVRRILLHRTVSGVATLAGVCQRTLRKLKSLAGSLSTSGWLVRRLQTVWYAVLAGSLIPTGLRQVRVPQGFAGSAIPTGAWSKSFKKIVGPPTKHNLITADGWSSTLGTGLIYLHDGFSMTILDSIENAQPEVPCTLNGVHWCNGQLVEVHELNSWLVFVHPVGFTEDILDQWTPAGLPTGVGFDGANLLVLTRGWQEVIVYKHAGLSSVILDSFDLWGKGVSAYPVGVGWDWRAPYTITGDEGAVSDKKAFRWEGFSNTKHDEVTLPSGPGFLMGLDWDSESGDLLAARWLGNFDNAVERYAGFSATLKESLTDKLCFKLVSVTWCCPFWEIGGGISPQGWLLKKFLGVWYVKLEGVLAVTGNLAARYFFTLHGLIAPTGRLVRRAFGIVYVPLAGVFSSIGTLARARCQALVGTLTSVGSVVKRVLVLKTLLGAIATAGSVVRRAFWLKALSGAVAAAGVLWRKVNVARAGSLSLAGKVVALVRKALLGAVASAGSVTRRLLWVKAVGGALVGAGALLTKTRKLIAGVLAGVGHLTLPQIAIHYATVQGMMSAGAALHRMTVKKVAGGATLAGTVARRIGLFLLLPGVLGLVGVVHSLARLKRAVGGIVTTAGRLPRRVFRGLAGAIVFVGALARVVYGFIRYVNVSGTQTLAGAVAARAGTFQLVTGAVTFSSALGRRIAIGLDGATSLAGRGLKKLWQGVTGGLTLIGALVRRLVGQKVIEIEGRDDTEIAIAGRDDTTLSILGRDDTTIELNGGI